MSVTNFIPTIWSARMLIGLKKAQVWTRPGVVNRDFEGDIRNRGDSVRINAIGPVTITSFTRNTDINSPEELTDAQVVLVVDQANYFNFQIDDVDRRQATPDFMSDAMAQAAYNMSDVQDQYVASLYSQIATANLIGLGGTVGTTSETFAATGAAYDRLVDLDVKLSEADVPRISRWVIVPPWYEGKLRKDDRFVAAGTPANVARLESDPVGRASGFDVYVSNNCPNPTGTTWKIVGGYPGAIGYAEQITEVVAYRPEKRFADAVKGLVVYGAKVIRPTGLVCLTADRP